MDSFGFIDKETRKDPKKHGTACYCIVLHLENSFLKSKPEICVVLSNVSTYPLAKTNSALMNIYVWQSTIYTSLKYARYNDDMTVSLTLNANCFKLILLC